MAFYLGNIQFNQAALENLGEDLPVKAQIVNLDGSLSNGLLIHQAQYDKFTSLGVKNIKCTGTGAGAFSPEARAQDPFSDGDTVICAANSLDATSLSIKLFTFADGVDESFLVGDEPLCALDADYAALNHISIGDEISMPVYLYLVGMNYEKIADQASFQVVATFGTAGKTPNPFSMLIPVDWMRKEAEASQLGFFCYDSCSADIENPRHELNNFKIKLADQGFSQVNSSVPSYSYTGESVYVYDEMFIETTRKLEENLLSYLRFLPLFFGIIAFLVGLTIFLTLRSSRQDMAILISLGEAKSSIILTYVGMTLILSLVSFGILFPFIFFLAKISFLNCLLICFVYLICELIGALGALLLLLRIDPMDLLTRID